ncbi:hypothetical protein M0802_007592 [Mischocyttarus mexicanus]|nr:hypothetical protein M0802_007592 [Mischocyttarus mexicanus]
MLDDPLIGVEDWTIETYQSTSNCSATMEGMGEVIGFWVLGWLAVEEEEEEEEGKEEEEEGLKLRPTYEDGDTLKWIVAEVRINPST